MLTRAGSAYLATGLALAAMGLLWGNDHYILAGTLPLFFVLGALGSDEPGKVEVERRASAREVRQGDEVRVRVRVRCRKGLGLLEVHCPLPEEFELVEGSNLHLFRKGRGRLEEEFAFTARCPKRGTFRLLPAEWEGVHALGVRKGARGTAGEELPIEVKPRLVGVKRVRGPPAAAKKFFPESDEARIGVRTTEFREIRDYVWGDPPRTINWKATARRQARLAGIPQELLSSAAKPLVNEYEREGKKTVWLFVDCGSYMEVGSNLENAFEHGLAAAGDLAKHYLDRGYSLGAYFYNGQGELLYPDAGGRQILRLRELLTRAAPREPEETLRRAVERCRGYLVTRKPLVVIVTRLPASADDTLAALRRIRTLTGRRRRRLAAVVVTPAVYNLVPRAGPHGEDAAHLLKRLDRPAIARVRAAGATVVEWDPARTAFAAVIGGKGK